MSLLRFHSGLGQISELRDWSEGAVKAEPMLFAASLEFATDAGGPITQDFIGQLAVNRWAAPGEHVVIDSRVHMLMPGWFPCIPGWHLDDVPRTRPDGQPDHAAPAYKAQHAMAIIGHGICAPRFFVGQIELEDVPVGGGVVYGKWHAQVEAAPGERVHPQPRGIYLFDWQSFHEGRPAIASGWRFFIRATKKTHRVALNQIRKQTQVYLPAPNAGW